MQETDSAREDVIVDSAFWIAPQIILDSPLQHEGMVLHPPIPSQIIHVQQQIASGSRIHVVEWNNSAVALTSLPTEVLLRTFIFKCMSQGSTIMLSKFIVVRANFQC